ncbi:DUF2905 domain-containing protein [Paenibacillus thiaminolyticus]|uniref:DUF2905 domain-containing protein n=1 Tax=Paenibacillus thiaminolyticus TaxID=49283 RepID=A0A378ZEM9_PANTH|nr:DUF2905 domain-containing protein [Paenibacillus thiaminolyticus]MCY9538803.1 DUF2905 domain-containing protein [Paenibacillus thiaminolyticus]MCY9604554.1 DUF2905 domain-containing protein [Paenibacillus thiaminolyticus]MCY9610587.1 DUF2905 domain-containing protein [Paenibacillus thiaminolyticus]MCY9614011.1 DUF2905 domain-containing protein [Paenibacillus thiaminolyticus]MCY9618548.1 DUF2905 domain-containing protein [Paenibacillus thiaminolyticus]
MPSMPKLLIGAGIVLIVVGVLWAVLGRWIPFGRLPGDIVVKNGGSTFYFPIVTCIIISIVGSLLLALFRK